MALDSNGDVYSWGNNNNGQFANGNTSRQRTPKKANISDVKDIVAVNNNTVFLKTDGTVWAAGRGYFGELGNGQSGSEFNKTTPVQVKGVDGTGYLTNIAQISGGEYGVLALASDGSVYSWGHRDYGHGDGTTGVKNTPVKVDLSDVVYINRNTSFDFAIDKNGVMYGWGYNYNGMFEGASNTAVLYPSKFKLGAMPADLSFISPPSVAFDGANKLTIKNAPKDATSITLKHTKGDTTTTTDLGTATEIVITEEGQYSVSIASPTVYVTSTNVVTVGTLLSSPLAFHHGNFDDAYGDGTVAAAAVNGHVYADTAPGTYSWGTLDSASSTSDDTTYKWTPASEMTADVLMVAGGGGGGGPNGGGGGAGGLLFHQERLYLDKKP